jgi:hypothetical protein
MKVSGGSLAGMQSRHKRTKTNEKWREVMRAIYAATRSPLAIFPG